MSDVQSQSKRVRTRDSFLKRRMADNPAGVTHPSLKGVQTKSKKFKRSIYYGFLTYILRTEFDNLSLPQQQWIVNYATRLSDEEILRAGRHTQLLLSDSDISLFHAKDILKVRRSIPWLEPFSAPEPVRIGKGYTDKGSLRPLHKKGIPSEIALWDEDITYLLPFDYETKGEWLTADEAMCLLGGPLFELVMLQLVQGRFSQHDVFNCMYNQSQ